jgi:nucleoside-diphosphate-sugar epimerase
VKLVVVGAQGTLGAALMKRLNADGVEVRCPDPTGDTPVPGLEEADVVINAGGPRVRKGLGWADYFREHVGVAARVVRSMREGAHLIHLSSTSVFGARRPGVMGPDTPEAPVLFPMPDYACAKLAAETMARTLGLDHGVDVTVVRPSMVYGPGVDSALGSIRKLAARGVRLHLTPNGTRQHLVHMDTLVRVLQRSIAVGPVDERLLIAADPFVLTNEDLRPPGKGIDMTLPVGVAAEVQRAWLSRLPTPLALDSLAVLALDHEFDSASTFAALDIDPEGLGRDRTFDSYWGRP